MKNPLRKLREQQNLTRRELARRTGLSYESCSLYETGARNTITDKAVIKFSKVLKVEPEALRASYREFKEEARQGE